MVLRNFITLENGVPAVMHFTDHTLENRDIVDPLTGAEKRVQVLAFRVDSLNFATVDAEFSVTSQKLSQALLPFTEGKRYLNLNITLVKSGTGFLTEYELQVSPR